MFISRGNTVFALFPKWLTFFHFMNSQGLESMTLPWISHYLMFKFLVVSLFLYSNSLILLCSKDPRWMQEEKMGRCLSRRTVNECERWSLGSPLTWRKQLSLFQALLHQTSPCQRLHNPRNGKTRSRLFISISLTLPFYFTVVTLFYMQPVIVHYNFSFLSLF